MQGAKYCGFRIKYGMTKDEIAAEAGMTPLESGEKASNGASVDPIRDWAGW